jgi:alkylation response protein AidB-like acyl-CoA dehydrogenase/predicted heme/steroid binding protein
VFCSCIRLSFNQLPNNTGPSLLSHIQFTMASRGSMKLTMEDVSKHNSEADCWVVVDGVVYDVTKFLKAHPGGKSILLAYAGKDITNEFYDFHSRDVLEKYGPKLKVGTIGENGNVALSEARKAIDIYTPFAEPTFLRGWKSPFYKEHHIRCRNAVRSFIYDTLRPLVEGCDENNEDPPAEAFLACGKAGIIAARIGPPAIPYVKELGIQLPGGINPDELDYFIESLTNYQLSACMNHGISDGLGAGLNIGLPPIIHFGTPAQKKKYVPPVLLGQKRICLAISEPAAGSDVAGMLTTAKLSPDGSHYIVNGIKKWITGGTAADIFVTAVRTGGPGHNGLSFLIIERSEGVTTNKIKTSYSGAASTALVMFENVKVPKENLIGPENSAFKMIMANFNHERWMIVHCWLGKIRTAVADCYRWSMQRKAFGRRLIDQPVIRYKLAEISAAIESLEAWNDSITYQMCNMEYKRQATELAAPIALLKFYTTRVTAMIADNAAQIFGGRGVTRTGMGKNIEEFNRAYKIVSIYGGSEEVLADMAVRQSVGMLDAQIAKGNKKAIVMSRL